MIWVSRQHQNKKSNSFGIYFGGWNTEPHLWPAAAACASVPGLLAVPGVPLEVPAAHPADVRLLRHAGLVCPLPCARAWLRLSPAGRAGCRRCRQWRRRHLRRLLQRHLAPGKSLLQRICLHPTGLPGHAVRGVPGGVLALLLQDSHVGPCRVPGW